MSLRATAVAPSGPSGQDSGIVLVLEFWNVSKGAPVCRIVISLTKINTSAQFTDFDVYKV